MSALPTVAFMGTNGGISFAADGFEKAHNRIGHNLGNMMFQFAMWRLIDNPKVQVSPHSEPSFVRDNCDILVIPAANQVHPAWDLGSWADFVESVDLPTVCIGLGAQTAIDGPASLDLKPGTVRYLRSVADRTRQIGVRGPFTGSVLAAIGVDNTTVTGCPSQTIHPAVDGREIEAGFQRLIDLEESACIGYALGTLEPTARDTEHRLMSWIQHFRHEIILQTDYRLLRTVVAHSASDEDREYIEWVGQVLRPETTGEFTEHLIKYGRLFSDARTWIDAMVAFDLVVGMRIHGAVAAIQAGQPGLCVAFDSRTLELAHTMGYPYVRSADVLSSANLRELVERRVFDAGRFNHLKQIHTERICTLLETAGCTVTSDVPRRAVDEQLLQSI